MQKNKLIRETKSVCPKCLKKIRADILEIDDNVYMVKECQGHGRFQLLLSRHPHYYRELSDFYFSVINKSYSQHDYIVHLTNRCNLNCPICLADANIRSTEDYPKDDLREFLKGKKNFKIDLMGAEPSMRKDLPAIIRMVKKSGNIAALHTNGIKLADLSYLRGLKDAGLDEVHFQFDGFDDHIYEKIRGEKLLQIKLKVLENLEKLNISTDLKPTVVKGVNEDHMVKILDFAVKHRFVKEVFFLGCRHLGRAKDLPIEGCIMPDELIDVLEEQTNGKISRQNILRFQKLYFTFLSIFCKRKCFYVHHFLISRQKKGYITIDKIIDLEYIEKKLDRFKQLNMSNKKVALFFLFFSLLPKFLTIKGISLLKDFLILKILFMFGFNLSKFPKKIILLGFISACDVHSFDYQISKNCGKGAVSVELGTQDVGALDNILRDRIITSFVQEG